MRFLIFVLLICYIPICHGQSVEHDTVTIKTIDKQVFIGQLISISADTITIENEHLGAISLAREDIAYMYDGIENQEVAKNHGEPYFIPTGIPNGRNNHYYRNYALFGQNFAFGLLDNFDVSFGFEMLSVLLVDDASWPVMQVGAKYSGKLANNVHVGLSTKFIFNNNGNIILTSLPITIGGLRSNFTFAPTLAQEYTEDYRGFVALLNFNIALSNKVRIVTDAIYAEGDIVATSLLEIKLKKNILIQPGILFSNEFQILPNFSFTLPFGPPQKRKY